MSYVNNLSKKKLILSGFSDRPSPGVPWTEDEHRRLYDAIASGNADRAKADAAEHVRVNREVTLRSLFGDDEPGERPAG